MMDLSPEAWFSEYEAAHEKTMRVLSSYDEQVARRAGQFYMGATSKTPVRQNYAHRWLSYVVPQLTGQEIFARVGSAMQAEGGEDFELELATNAWINDIQLRQFAARGPANDMQYNFGVVMVVPEPVAGAKPIEGVGSDWAPGDPNEGAPPARTPWQARVYRVPQKRYLEDALAVDRDSVRWNGHIWVRDINSILEEGEKGGWDVAALKDYAADAQLEALGRPEYGGLSREVKRNEIVGVDIWYPEYQIPADNPWGVPASPGPEQGYHGTIFTLLVSRITLIAAGGSGDIPRTLRDLVKQKAATGFPRKPRPWYGSERGPYVVFGQFTVPEHSLPLGALTAVEQEMRELNTDVDVAQRMMRAFKRFLAVGRGGEQRVQVLKDAVHDWIYHIPGITKDDVIQGEFGGLDQQALAHIEFSRDNLETTLGLTEMNAGKVSGVGTATEQTIANNSAQSRFAGVQLAFEDGMVDVIYRGAFFIYNDNRFGKHLGPKAGEELVKRGMAQKQLVSLPDGRFEERWPDPLVLGGERRGIQRIPWEALSIRVELTERANSARRQQEALAMLQVVERMTMLAAQYPAFPLWKLAEKLGPALNFPGLAELFGKPDEIAASAVQVAQAMAGGEQAGARAGPTRSMRAPASSPSAGAGKPSTTRTPQSRGAAGARSRSNSNGAAPKPGGKK